MWMYLLWPRVAWQFGGSLSEWLSVMDGVSVCGYGTCNVCASVLRGLESVVKGRVHLSWKGGCTLFLWVYGCVRKEKHENRLGYSSCPIVVGSYSYMARPIIRPYVSRRNLRVGWGCNQAQFNLRVWLEVEGVPVLGVWVWHFVSMRRLVYACIWIARKYKPVCA